MDRTPLIALTGFIAGAVLAGIGIVLAPDAGSTGVASTTTVAPDITTRAGPWWFSPEETRLGPTVILPESLTVEDGQVVFRYETADLSPPAIGRMRSLEESNPFFASPRVDPVAAPERWVLETVDGEYPGASPSARTPTARFDVPDGFVLGRVTGLRIESYRMRMPYVYEMEVSSEPGITYRLDDGVSFMISQVLRQVDTTIVQVDYETPADAFTAGEPTPVIVSGVGPEWLSYNGRGGVTGGLQLVRRGNDLPETIVLQVRTTYWIPFETSVSIDMRGVPIG